jgi:hypothetical protein
LLSAGARSVHSELTAAPSGGTTGHHLLLKTANNRAALNANGKNQLQIINADPGFATIPKEITV